MAAQRAKTECSKPTRQALSTTCTLITPTRSKPSSETDAADACRKRTHLTSSSEEDFQCYATAMRFQCYATVVLFANPILSLGGSISLEKLINWSETKLMIIWDRCIKVPLFRIFTNSDVELFEIISEIKRFVLLMLFG